MKIVSLLPSATEIVYALGLDDYLCGVTFECDHPADARSKPIVSTSSLQDVDGASPAQIDSLVADKVAQDQPLYRIDEALIQELQPDLILAQDLCRVCAVPSGQVTKALDKLGCRAEVVSLDPNTIEDILRSIEEVGRVAGARERAKDFVTELRERVRSVAARAEALDKIPTLALEWPEPPFLGGHWVPEMVRVAGGRDVLGHEASPSRRATWDEIEAAAPEVVVYMPCGYYLEDAVRQARDLYSIPQFGRLPAAKSQQVFAVDASAYFSRPGPRIVDGIEILAWMLHPDTFAPPPEGRVSSVSDRNRK